MNRSGFTARSSAAGVLAAAAASGLVLAGCGNSSGSDAASTSGSGSGQAAGGASASAAASSGSSGNTSTVNAAFFPLTVGNKWVYAVKGGETVTNGTVTNQVIALAPAAGGTKATLKDKELLEGSPTTTTSTIIVHSDGSISVPLTQVGNSAFKLESGSIIWPSAAELASGQPHHDTLVIRMGAAGQATTVRAHVVVKGDGTQTVQVPAGTYQATVINETMTEKVSGFAVTLNIRTWVANGVGPVKDEVTSSAGGRSAISIVEVLKSFTKG
jgi:hypothetical protein